MAKKAINSSKKRHFLFNPLKRPLPYIGLILALVITVSQSTIRQFTANLVGDWLVKTLSESTEGNYTLNYDYVRFDIFTSELRIQNFNLELDSGIDRKEYLENYNNLIEVSTPIMVLKLESLWDLLIEEKLRIAYIGLKEPSVKLIRSESLSDEEIEVNQQVSAEKLRTYLNEIEIDSFRVLNGAIDIALQNAEREGLIDFKIRNFSTLMRGFKLDEIDPSKVFQGIYAEEVELEILDQAITLPLLHHEISFNRLWVSSKDSVISIDTLQVIPLPSADSSFVGNLNLNQFSLTGIDFKKAYEEDKLIIKNVDLINPEIALFAKAIPMKASGPKVFTQPFKQIILQNINLSNGSLDLDINKRIHTEKINLSVSNYSIDSTLVLVSELAKNIGEFELSLTNNRIDLPDSIHEIQISSIKLNSNDSTALLTDLTINPIPQRRSYSNYKERGVKHINYGTIKRVFAAGLDFNLLINNQQLLADSLLLLGPSMNITEYPYIKVKSNGGGDFDFLVRKTFIANGKVNYNRRQNQLDNRTFAQGISFEIENLHSATSNPVEYDNVKIIINNGYSDLQSLGHRVTFSGLESENLTDLDISSLTLEADSNLVNKSVFNIKGQGVRLRGFDQPKLTNLGELEIDELTMDKLTVDAQLVTTDTSISKKPGRFNKLVINRFYLDNGSLKLTDPKNIIEINNVSTLIDSLNYSPLKPTYHAIPVDYSDLLFRHEKFKYKSKDDAIEFSGDLGEFIEADSLIRFEDISFRSRDIVNATVKEVRLKGLDRQSLFRNKGIRFNYLLVDQSNLTVSPTKSTGAKSTFNQDSLKSVLLNKLAYVDFDSVISRNTNLDVITSNGNRSTTIENLDLFIGKYLLDTTSFSNQLLNPDSLKLHFSRLTTSGKNDTTTVNGAVLDLINSTVYTGRIDVSTIKNKASFKAVIPGLMANGFLTSQLLNGNYSIDTIRLAQAKINLITIDSIKQKVDLEWLNNDLSTDIKSLFKKNNSVLQDALKKAARINYDFGFAQIDSVEKVEIKRVVESVIPPENEVNEPLDSIQENSLPKAILPKMASPTHGMIKHVTLNNSVFNWTKNGQQHSFLDSISFSIGIKGVILDSLNEFNVYDHIEDVNVKIKDYRFNLPDSLNSLSFDELEISTKSESLAIKNIALTPKVNKYDYADRVGYQVGWHKLQNLDLKIERLNLFHLLSDKVIHAETIIASEGNLSIFKDKELPIPVNQRRPMLQDAIKGINLPLLVDTVLVENISIDFSSRLSSSMPEGALSFNDLNAVVTNVTNIDSSIFIHPELNVSASAKIMNKGLLEANFSFDLDDENNGFDFDGHLSEMEAKEFNSLLSALAFVNIESGQIKDLTLNAHGDNYYATGNMKFIYNNLKVSTINKKNLKTKGMGKVIKSFFANAFVVKKNNPAFKVFPRDGAMYYERDPQKIVIDYVTKTALSGVISSIGARNARKDIKKLQKESKKEKDAERKSLKKSGQDPVNGED